VEWYRSVKKTQGSVEVTSYDQMDNIFDCGCYIIGVREAVTVADKSTKDVIRLKLKEKDVKRPLTKKNYNLEELRDLASKLVLITGSNAANRKRVDVFVDVSIFLSPLASLFLCLF
jgi:hypothetical protein